MFIEYSYRLETDIHFSKVSEKILGMCQSFYSRSELAISLCHSFPPISHSNQLFIDSID